MRYTASEKLEIIQLVSEANLPAKQVLAELGVARSSFYRWVNLCNEHGFEGLEDHTRGPFHIWNQIPDEIREHVVEVAMEELENSPGISPIPSDITSRNRALTAF